VLKIGFLGEFDHSMDEKGRVSIPSRYKKYIEKITENPEYRNVVILVKGKDKCVEAFPAEDWSRMMGDFSQEMKLDDKEEDRKYVNDKLRKAMDVKIDKSGRILIPPQLKEYAGLSSSVKIVGGGDRFMIWDEKVLDGLDGSEQQGKREQ